MALEILPQFFVLLQGALDLLLPLDWNVRTESLSPLDLLLLSVAIHGNWDLPVHSFVVQLVEVAHVVVLFQLILHGVVLRRRLGQSVPRVLDFGSILDGWIVHGVHSLDVAMLVSLLDSLAERSVMVRREVTFHAGIAAMRFTIVVVISHPFVREEV